MKTHAPRFWRCCRAAGHGDTGKDGAENLDDFGDDRIAPAIKSTPGKPLPTAMAARKDPIAVGMRVHGMSTKRAMRMFDDPRAIREAIRDPRDAPHELLHGDPACVCNRPMATGDGH